MPDHDSTLDALDDDALREIAYGRAASPTDLMRADRAARILAARSARARTADAIPTGAAPAGGSAPTPPGDLETAHTAAESDADDDETRNERRRRGGAMAGLVVGALAAGLVAGAAIGPLTAAAAPESLAVFDRDATAEEESLARQLAGPETTTEVRALTSVGAAEVFAVRSDGLGFFGTDDLGRQICVIASHPNRSFFPQSCTPEQIFAERGLTGFLPGFSGGATQELESVLSFSWGPRGDIEVSDDTEALLPPIEERFTEEERAQGLDIRAIRFLEQAPTVTTSDPRLANAELGPADVGRVSSTMLLGTVERAPGGERQVCLYALSGGEVGESACASLGLFREQGVRAVFELVVGSADVTWRPDGSLESQQLN